MPRLRESRGSREEDLDRCRWEEKVNSWDGSERIAKRRSEDEGDEIGGGYHSQLKNYNLFVVEESDAERREVIEDLCGLTGGSEEGNKC